jgi:hypothetical protein
MVPIIQIWNLDPIALNSKPCPISEKETLILETSVKDIEELPQLINELGYPTSREEMGGRFNTIQIQKDYKTLIASHQGHVAGMIGLQNLLL